MKTSKTTSLPWNEALRALQQGRSPLVITHRSPDGDAVGSLLAMGLLLKALGQRPTLACQDPVPTRFHYLPHHQEVVSEVPEGSFDLVISLDCSDRERMGQVYDADRLASLPLLNIDHHVTNLNFGTVNLVVPTAASTTQIIYELVQRLSVPLDVPLATCLLTGLVTDTLAFRTANVTPQVMEIALRLIRAGASLYTIVQRGLVEQPLSALRLLAVGLSRMQVEGHLAWSEVRLADREATGYQGDSDAGLVGRLISAEEIRIAAVFKEVKDGRVEISMRAAPGYDVSGVALRLGGGGHPAAAGCTLNGSLEAAKARVLPLLRAALAEQEDGRHSEH